MKLTQISATQVTMFDDRDDRLGCHRKWHYNYIHKLRGPPTPAMERGKKIHTELEHTLKTRGQVRDTEFAPYVYSTLPHLPIAGGKLKAGIEKRLLIEMRMWLQLEPALGWLGFIDLLFSRAGNGMVIWDHKTTSDFRYAKTPEELAKNIQLISYARWAYEKGHKGMIDLVHFYIQTKPKCPKKPKVLYRNRLVSEAHVRSVWDNEVLPVIPEMKEVAAVPKEDTQLLRPNTRACPMYRGCEFRSKCGIETTISSMFATPTKGSDMSSSFLDKIKAKAAAENAKGGEEQQGHTGVLPDDAPSRTTPVETKSEEEPKKTKRGRKKMTDEEKALAKAKRDLEKAKAKAAEAEAAAAAEAQTKAVEAKPVPTKKTNGSNGASEFTLYINCYPQKDVHRDIEPTLFEDFFGPIAFAMNETAQEKSDKPHYMLLSFGDQKAMILSAVQDSIGRLPKELVVNTKAQGASEALSVLIPHATRVIRAGG